MTMKHAHGQRAKPSARPDTWNASPWTAFWRNVPQALMRDGQKDAHS